MKGKRKVKGVKRLQRNIEIVTLSDSEDTRDSEIEIIEKSEDIVQIDDSGDEENVSDLAGGKSKCLNCTTDMFCIHVDRTPDFIPVNAAPDFIPIRCSYSNRKGKRRGNKFADAVIIKKDKNFPNPVLREVKRRFKKPAAWSNAVVVKKEEQCKIKKTIHLEQPNILYTGQKNHLGLRPVIIDGPNVAFRYGNGEFKPQGIILVIQFFLKRGHEEIVCFLPEHFRHKNRTPEENKILLEYEKMNIIVYTPSRKLGGHQIFPYDDRFIVQYASEREGVIITNDGYRDLINEEKSWKKTIEKRIINYTFAREMLMLPRDPLGPDGPTLDEMLKFPVIDETVINLV